MERRMFLFSGLLGLLPLGRRRRRRRCKEQTEVGSLSLTPRTPTIQYETRDKIGNTDELFEYAQWRRRFKNALGEQRVAYAFLPRDRAFTYYVGGNPKIWWGACVVIQYRYSDPEFLSAISVHAITESDVEDFPAGEIRVARSVARRYPGTLACRVELFARESEEYAAEAGKSALLPQNPIIADLPWRPAGKSAQCGPSHPTWSG